MFGAHMNFEFMTREVWEALIIGMMILGMALAAVRLYADFSRKDALDE